MIARIKTFVNGLIKPHTFIHNRLKSVLSGLGLTRKVLYSDKSYREWIRLNEPSSSGLLAESNDVLVSVVIPCWNTPDKYLNPLTKSLVEQTTQSGWEAIIVDVSTDSKRSAAIKKICNDHQNFRYVKVANLDISSNTNSGILHARGRYIAFVDHDDTLSTEAMNEVILCINDSKPDIIYSDEDKIDDSGRIRHSPYFKPDWSPEVLLYTNYINHLTVIKKELIDMVGGLDPRRNGSQDYDLLLRVISVLRLPQIVHIPKILYHWREAKGSTAVNHGNKKYAFVAGKKAIESYLSGIGLDSKTLHIKNSPGFYKQMIKALSSTKVLIVCGKEVTRVRDLIENNTRTELEVRFSEEVVSGYDVIIHINERVRPIQKDWIDQLVGVLQIHGVRTVSPRILNKDGRTIKDAGIVSIPASNRVSGIKDYFGILEDEYTPSGSARGVRNIETESTTVYAERAGDKTPGRNTLWSHVDFVEVDD